MYRLTDKYPDINVEWGPAYSLPFCSTLESKAMDFRYKILNCIFHANEKLYGFVSLSCLSSLHILSRKNGIHLAFAFYPLTSLAKRKRPLC